MREGVGGARTEGKGTTPRGERCMKEDDHCDDNDDDTGTTGTAFEDELEEIWPFKLTKAPPPGKNASLERERHVLRTPTPCAIPEYQLDAALRALISVEDAVIDPCSADAEGCVRNNALYRCDRTTTVKFLQRYVRMLSGDAVTEC